MKKSSRATSMLLMFCAMFVFGTVGVFRKFIPSVSSVTLACIRGIIGATFLFLITLIKKEKPLKGVSKKNLLLLFISGAMIGANWYLLFESFNYTTVPVGTLFYYTEPTILILVCAIFFKERMTPHKTVCAIAAFAGMIMVSGVIGGTLVKKDLTGILLAFTAAILYTCVVLINKRIVGVGAYPKTMIQLASAAAVLIPFIIVDIIKTGTSPLPQNGTEIVFMLIMGVLHTGISYTMYFGSMENLSPRTIAILSYIDPVTALVVSAVFLSEKMDIWGIIGAVLIIGAAAVSELVPDDWFKKKNRKKY